HCESISARGLKQPWSLTEHRHYDLHQFFWITRGGGRVVIDGVTHGFGANTAIFIPNLIVHGFEFTPGTVGWLVSIAKGLPIAMPSEPMMCILPSPRDQAYLTGDFNNLNAEYVADTPDRQETLLHHAGLLSIRYRRMKSGSLRKGFSNDSARRRLMRKFIARLEDRYGTPDTVKDYAGALEVTTTHLTRVCRETTGKPATKLIQDRTMLEARRSLANTKLKVRDISDDLGFQTPAYFTRVFTATTGKSPRTFRRDAQSMSLINPNARSTI
ncbi:MAG: AraC family transcriptional regulator, partial [Amylibacter sp.]